MTGLRAITPMIAVADVMEAVAFFTETLGFEATLADEYYAYLRRDGCGLRLLRAAPGADMTDEARQQTIYVDVDDVDALYATLHDRLAALPEGHLRPPFDRDYGQREFHVIHGPLLIFFGAAITPGGTT